MTLTQSIQDSLKRLQALASGNATGEDHSPETLSDVANVVSSMSLKDYATLAKVGVDGATKKNVNDKTYLMEHVIQVVADLPTKSVLSSTLTHQFLDQLWTDLQHPPQSYLGKDYAFRKADGSNNNFLWPHIGAAGQPYARSVKPVKMQPIARPDPGVVFDSILKRKKWEPHPNKISSVLFYVASVIIHDCFHTSHTDFNKSETSSYLDLSPLYGSNADQQKLVRTMKDGKLKPDCFFDQRILGFPPGVGLLLIFFNRFHNDVVEKLAQIDENGRFSRVRYPPASVPGYDGEKEYDEALFQTARLVTCGLYINVILQDYVRTILNLNRTGTKWNLDPRAESGKALFGKDIPVATGNQVSAEFNLVYRWHSTVSERDARWTEERAATIFPVRTDGEEPTMKDFLQALRKWSSEIDEDPFKRDFEGLKRDKETGRFLDDDLAQIWTESVEDVAGSFGANRVPEILKMVEVLGITQSRTWNLGSLNEFRRYFKLQPHETFESINPDRGVQEQLKRLYGHPDNVEIYPGIVVEAAKEPMTPGSGLCANFTISRAILSDAVALVRGDRFYTVDYTPQNLTNWGFDAAGYDINIDDGCVFYKLILNALPKHYTRNSVYAHYPLTIPKENEKILKSLKVDHIYDFATPKTQPAIKSIRSFGACKTLFQTAAKTHSLSTIVPPELVTGGRISQTNGVVDSQTLTALREYLSENPNRKYITRFFQNITMDLLQKHNYDIAGIREVDIIRDVGNLAQVHFAACVFALPLKTLNNPDGAFDAEQLWAILTALYSSIHTISNPARSFRAQINAQGAMEGLAEYVVNNVRSADPEHRGWIDWATNLLHQQHSGDLTDQSTHLIQEMIKTGIRPEDLTYDYLLPVAATIVVSQARAFAECLNFILDYEQILDSIQNLIAADTEKADAQIEKIVLEVLRLNSKNNIYVTPSANVRVTENGEPLTIAANETVLCHTRAANRDNSVFERADEYDPDRGVETYLPGTHTLPPMFPGQELSRAAMVGMLKAVLRLQDIRRAKGPVGKMKTVLSGNGSRLYLVPDESEANIYPSSMKVNFGPRQV